MGCDKTLSAQRDAVLYPVPRSTLIRQHREYFFADTIANSQNLDLSKRILFSQRLLTCMSKNSHQDLVWWKICLLCFERRVVHHTSDHVGLQASYGGNKNSERVVRIHKIPEDQIRRFRDNSRVVQPFLRYRCEA